MKEVDGETAVVVDALRLALDPSWKLHGPLAAAVHYDDGVGEETEKKTGSGTDA
jgi:hypothetical protein